MDNREKTIVRTSIIGILANIALVVGKAIVGILSNSISIIIDAVNNLLDSLSSIITIVGTKLAHKKPDAKHPYGHGRVEYLTSMVIAIIILVTGIMAGYESILTFITPKVTNYSILTIIIVVIAVFVKIILGLYYKKMGKKTNSDSLVGSGVDALSDAILSLGTLVGVLTSLLFSFNIEAFVGFIIGIFMIKSGIEIIRSAFSSVVGERANKEIVQGVKEVVYSHSEVKGAYDLIINNYGPERAIGSIHIEVDDNMQAKDIHPLSRKIAEEIYYKFGIIMTIGIYASNTDNEEIFEIKKYVCELIKKYEDIKQLHGFYLDTEKDTISFDIIIDFKNKNPNQIKEDLIKELQEKYSKYKFFIIIDTDFSD